MHLSPPALHQKAPMAQKELPLLSCCCRHPWKPANPPAKGLASRGWPAVPTATALESRH